MLCGRREWIHNAQAMRGFADCERQQVRTTLDLAVASQMLIFLSLLFLAKQSEAGCSSKNTWNKGKNLTEMLWCDFRLWLPKNPRAHKNKIGTPPPPKNPIPPPPQTEEFYGHGFSCRTDAFFQASIKLAQPFPAPELRTKTLRTRGFFWNQSRKSHQSISVRFFPLFQVFLEEQPA